MAPLSVALVVIAIWVALHDSLPGDRWVLIQLHTALGRSIDHEMKAVSDATDTQVLFVIAIGILVALLFQGRRRDAMWFMAAAAVVWTVNPILKEIVGRPRPTIRPLPDAVSSLSFPSGHASGTGALVGALLLILHGRRLRMLAAILGSVFVVAVAFSQIALTVHYPSDIVAGWLWAATWIFFVSALKRHADCPRHGSCTGPP